MRDIEGTIIWSGLLILVVLTFGTIAGAIVFAVRQAQVEKVCLSAGYPTVAITYTLEAYCTKRVNQTDIVVPLSEAAK